MNGLDGTVIALYMTIVLGIGFLFGRYIRQIKDYFAGGNEIPWWVAGISFFMTGFSSIVFTAYAGIAYRGGFEAVTLFWTVVPALLIGVFFLSHRWRRAGILSPVEFLETRYSAGVRQLYAWTTTILVLVDNASRTYAMALFLNRLVNLSMPMTIVASGLIMGLTTLIGGIWAASVTDVVQFIILAGSLFIVIPLALDQSGGWSGFVSQAPDGFFDPLNKFSMTAFIGLTLLTLVSYNARWSLVQRYYCVPSERDARKVGWLGAALFLIGAPIWTLPSMLAVGLVPGLQGAETENAFAAVCQKVLPAGLMGLMVSGILSATMSTLSSEFNNLSAVLTRDIYQRLLRPQASDRELVSVGRGATLLVTAIITGLALAVPLFGGVWKVMMGIFSILGPPTMVPVLWGILFRKGSPLGATLALVLGTTAGIVVHYLGLEWKWDPNDRTAYVIFASLGTSLLCLVATTGRSVPDRVHALFERLNTPIERHELRKGGPSPFFLVGLITFLIGVMMLPLGFFIERPLARHLDWGVGGVLALLGGLMALRSRGRF